MSCVCLCCVLLSLLLYCVCAVKLNIDSGTVNSRDGLDLAKHECVSTVKCINSALQLGFKKLLEFLALK